MNEPATIAALDIGSNSFQLIVARQISGRLEILHKEKLKVHLAEGLDENGDINEEALQRAEVALKEFSNTLQGFNAKHVKIVATYTVRKARNKLEFIKRAKKFLPFNIDIISGLEEARLIYQGVANYRFDTEKRLVIDIGGGSTEFIIGQSDTVFNLASRSMGCVTYQQLFFNHNRITKQAFKQAIVAASQEIEPILNAYTNSSWQCAIGTSGSFKAILNIVQQDIENDFNFTEINYEHLQLIKQELISFGHTDKISFLGLSEERRTIISSALAIAIACFELLKIKKLSYCDFSLREGVLHDLVDCSDNKNLKQRSIRNFANRFNCDVSQSNRVKEMLNWLFSESINSWGISVKIKQILLYAAEVYEVGLSVSSSNTRKHSAYIIENCLLPGFSQEEQFILTQIVRNYRKKLKLDSNLTNTEVDIAMLLKGMCIFRLALLFTQKRQCDFVKIETITFLESTVVVKFEQEWWDQQSLLHADFEKEASLLKPHGITLSCENFETKELI